MANGIGLGAREIISLGVDKGSNRAAQRRHANTRFQKWANFLKEPDSKGSDCVAGPCRQDPNRAYKQSVYGVCFLDVDLRSYDRAAADCPRFCHTFQPDLFFPCAAGIHIVQLRLSMLQKKCMLWRPISRPNCASSFYLDTTVM